MNYRCLRSLQVRNARVVPFEDVIGSSVSRLCSELAGTNQSIGIVVRDRRLVGLMVLG